MGENAIVFQSSEGITEGEFFGTIEDKSKNICSAKHVSARFFRDRMFARFSDWVGKGGRGGGGGNSHMICLQ